MKKQKTLQNVRMKEEIFTDIAKGMQNVQTLQKGDKITATTGEVYHVLNTIWYKANLSPGTKNTHPLGGLLLSKKQIEELSIKRVKPTTKYNETTQTQITTESTKGVIRDIGPNVYSGTLPYNGLICGMNSNVENFEMWVGMDTEYETCVSKKNKKNVKRNCLLSSQWAFRLNGELVNAIVFYAPGGKRAKMETTLSTIFSLLEPWVNLWNRNVMITLITHFGIADLGHFCVGKKGIRIITKNAFVVHETFMSRGYICCTVNDRSWNRKSNVSIAVRDSYLLSPGDDGRSLAVLGEVLGYKKLCVMDEFKKCMSKGLAERTFDYIVYGVRDAEIPLLWVENVMKYYGKYFYYKYNSKRRRSVIPITIGQIAADLVSCNIKSFNGYDSDKELHRVYYGLVPRKKLDLYKKKYVLRHEANSARALIDSLAAKAYLGGRNEASAFGVFSKDSFPKFYWKDNRIIPVFDNDDTPFIDWDLSSAYGSAMLGLHDIDFSVVPDYYKGPITFDVVPSPNTYIYADVAFKFPEKVMFPCLPVSDTEDRGLIFPREGRTVASGPDLWLALKMGAKIKAYSAVIPHTKNRMSIPYAILELMLEREKALRKYGKGSIQERLAKAIVNSCYGKMGQGIKGKKVYSPSSGKSEEVKESIITCAAYASHITSYVRAVVSAAMEELFQQYGIYTLSVTTDGLIAQVPEEKMQGLSLYGLAEEYKKNRYKFEKEKALYFNEDVLPVDKVTIWEKKHEMDVVAIIKTRGNASPEPGGVAAAAGYKLEPKDYEKMEKNKWAKSQLLFHMYVNRTGRIENIQSTRPSARKMLEFGVDMIEENKKRKISLEYDLKRKPYFPWHAVTPVEGNGSHVGLITLPWETYKDFSDVRNYVDKSHMLVVKHSEDIQKLKVKIEHAFACHGMGVKKVRAQQNFIADAVKYVLRIIRHNHAKCKNIEGKKGVEIIDLISKVAGTNISKDAWKNAGRKSRGSFVVDSSVMDLLVKLGVYAVSDVLYDLADAAGVDLPHNVEVYTFDNNILPLHQIQTVDKAS